MADDRKQISKDHSLPEQPKVGSGKRLLAKRCTVCGYWPAFDVPVGLGDGVPPGHRCTHEWVEVEPVGESAREVERRLRCAVCGEQLKRGDPLDPDFYCPACKAEGERPEAESARLREALEKIGTMSPDGTGTLRPIWSKLEMVKIARKALAGGPAEGETE
jgi:hypothetical protein